MPPKRRSHKLDVENDRACAVAATGDGAAARSVAAAAALAVAAEQTVDFGRDGAPRLFAEPAGTVAGADRFEGIANTQYRT